VNTSGTPNMQYATTVAQYAKSRFGPGESFRAALNGFPREVAPHNGLGTHLRTSLDQSESLRKVVARQQ
jgi:hypothetical protein